MNFVEDVNIIEDDVQSINDKCDKINCNPIYETFKAILKLFVDLFRFCKPKNI